MLFYCYLLICHSRCGHSNFLRILLCIFTLLTETVVISLRLIGNSSIKIVNQKHLSLGLVHPSYINVINKNVRWRVCLWVNYGFRQQKIMSKYKGIFFMKRTTIYRVYYNQIYIQQPKCMLTINLHITRISTNFFTKLQWLNFGFNQIEFQMFSVLNSVLLLAIF